MRCFFCKGDLAQSTTTHVVTLENCIIIVKNVPCTRCTQCGESFFDDEVAAKLEEIVKSCSSSMVEITVVNYSNRAA